MLWRGGASAERWCSQLAPFGASAEAIRPNAWDGKLLTSVLRSGDVFEGTGLAILIYQWFLDRGEIEEARKWVDAAIENIEGLPKPLHSSVAAEAAYFHALYGGRNEELRDWLERARRANPPLSEYTLLRAIAAVERAEGNTEDAIRAIFLARRALEKAPHTGSTLAEYDWLQRVAEGLPGIADDWPGPMPEPERA